MGEPADETAPQLLRELSEALARAPGRVREIEVGVPLSIVLGQRRTAVECGGCAVPLEFEGIPARTNAHLRSAFRLILAEPTPS